MTAQIIDGKKIAAEIRDKLKKKISKKNLREPSMILTQLLIIRANIKKSN